MLTISFYIQLLQEVPIEFKAKVCRDLNAWNLIVTVLLFFLYIGVIFVKLGGGVGDALV